MSIRKGQACPPMDLDDTFLKTFLCMCMQIVQSKEA